MANGFHPAKLTTGSCGRRASMGAGSLLAHGASSARLASLTFVLFLLVSSTSTWVLAYDVYEDGAVGQSLPGSPSDPRGLPNSPFAVDANRLSDGVSSFSPLSTTSPSFPFYRNVTDDDGDELARQRARLTMASRLEQGVSRRGAGNFETSVARYNLLSSDFSADKPSASFSVHAWERWSPSSFAIQQGETYTVGVPGEQYWRDGNIRSDAGGYAAYYDAVDSCWVAVGRCRVYLYGATPRVAPPRARWMELVCGIGDYVLLLREATSGEERYLPIQEEVLRESLLAVGRNFTFVADTTGELVCFANDGEGLYGNNEGTLNVTVTRESWPPDGVIERTYEGYVDTAPTVHP